MHPFDIRQKGARPLVDNVVVRALRRAISQAIDKHQHNRSTQRGAEDDQKQLKGFTWREEERPDRGLINAWRTPKIRDKERFNFFYEPDVMLKFPDEDEIQKHIDK